MLEIGVQPGELVGQVPPFLRADESALRAGGAFRVVPARPDRIVVGEGELRGVARDGKGIHPGLLGEHQAEGHAVVVGPRDHAKRAVAVLQRQGQFVVVIPHVAVLAELVFPMSDRPTSAPRSAPRVSRPASHRRPVPAPGGTAPAPACRPR